LNFTDPRAPGQTSALEFNVTVTDLEVWQTTVLLAGREVAGSPAFGEIVGIDVSNPLSPREAFRNWRPATVADIAVQGNRLYAATSGGDLEVWGIQSSGLTYVSSLHLRDSGSGGSDLRGIDVSGGRALVTAGDGGAGGPGLYVVNLTTPPVLARFVDLPAAAVKVVSTNRSVFVSLLPDLRQAEREVAELTIDAADRVQVAAILHFKDLGWGLATDSSGQTVYSLGEYDLAIARQVPVSLLESSLTIQLVVVSVAVTAFVSVVVVVIRKRKWREQDETDPQENSGP
jgi:hypothetical protein